MGKPATTYWCKNGHLLEDNPHHHYGPRDTLFPLMPGEKDTPIPCPICNSTKNYCVCEWQDAEYWKEEEFPIVPFTPSHQEYISIKDHLDNPYWKAIDVYDISKLKKE